MVTRTNRLLELLDDAAVEYEVIPHRPDFTAQRTAADTHTPGRQFAKTVVLEADGSYALAVLPAHHRVHFARLRELLGTEINLASEQKVAELFPDCEVGAEPPFGNLYGLPVYVSPELAHDRYITFNGGTHHEAVRMRYADFERLVRPTILDFSWAP
jgi:Ala-tRNA(Pro) deacylase